MASVCATRLCNRPATFIRQRRASPFTSYSSPTCACRDAFTWSPLHFTFPLSHAVAAWERVLNKRMDHRYLSILSFSVFSVLPLIIPLFLATSKLMNLAVFRVNGEWPMVNKTPIREPIHHSPLTIDA